MNQQQFFAPASFLQTSPFTSYLSEASVTTKDEVEFQWKEINRMINIERDHPFNGYHYYDTCTKMLDYVPKVFDRIFFFLKRNMNEDEFNLLRETLHCMRNQQREIINHKEPIQQQFEEVLIENDPIENDPIENEPIQQEEPIQNVNPISSILSYQSGQRYHLAKNTQINKQNNEEHDKIPNFVFKQFFDNRPIGFYEWYLDIKPLFEQTHFYYNDNVYVIQPNNIITYMPQYIARKHLKVECPFYRNYKNQFSFVNTWLEDPNRRTYFGVRFFNDNNREECEQKKLFDLSTLQFTSSLQLKFETFNLIVKYFVENIHNINADFMEYYKKNHGRVFVQCVSKFYIYDNILDAPMYVGKWYLIYFTYLRPILNLNELTESDFQIQMHQFAVRNCFESINGKNNLKYMFNLNGAIQYLQDINVNFEINEPKQNPYVDTFWSVPFKKLSEKSAKKTKISRESSDESSCDNLTQVFSISEFAPLQKSAKRQKKFNSDESNDNLTPVVSLSEESESE